MTITKNTELQLSRAKAIRWWVIGLIVVALLIFALRNYLIQESGLPGGDTVWQVQMRLEFNSRDAGVPLRLSPPWDTDKARIIKQQFSHPGLNVRRVRSAEKAGREITALTTQTGPVRLFADFTVHVSTTSGWRAPEQATELEPDRRAHFTKDGPGFNLEAAIVKHRYQELTQTDLGDDSLADVLFYYVNERIAFHPGEGEQSADQVLERRRGNALGKARTLVALCRTGKIPARVITGYLLNEGLDVAPHFWVEIYSESGWQAYDPTHGFKGELPAEYLPVRRSDTPIVVINDVVDYQFTVDITQDDFPTGLISHERKRLIDIFDLTRLPLSMRTTLAALLLLPLGALLTAFLRHMVGIRTYGTFTPTLLGLAALYADVITITVISTVVALIGIFGRSQMPRLKLLRVQRLTIVFVLVAMSMTIGVSLMDYFDLNPSGFVVLLPIVVLTSLVDRLYSVADEEGMPIALKRLLWTVVVAGLCYLILLQEAWGTWLLVYPEMHFITIALVILMAAYRGRKLSQRLGLEWLTEPQAKNKKKSPRGEDPEG